MPDSSTQPMRRRQSRTNGPANSGTTVQAALIGRPASGHNYPRLHRPSVLCAGLLVAELDMDTVLSLLAIGFAAAAFYFWVKD